MFNALIVLVLTGMMGAVMASSLPAGAKEVSLAVYFLSLVAAVGSVLIWILGILLSGILWSAPLNQQTAAFLRWKLSDHFAKLQSSQRRSEYIPISHVSVDDHTFLPRQQVVQQSPFGIMHRAASTLIVQESRGARTNDFFSLGNPRFGINRFVCKVTATSYFNSVILKKCRTLPEVLHLYTEFGIPEEQFHIIGINVQREAVHNQGRYSNSHCGSRLNSGCISSVSSDRNSLSGRFPRLIRLSFHQVSLMPDRQPHEKSNQSIRYCDVYDDPIWLQKPSPAFWGLILLIAGGWLAVGWGIRRVDHHMRCWDWLIVGSGYIICCMGATLLLYGHAWPPAQEPCNTPEHSESFQHDSINVTQKHIYYRLFL